MVAEQILSGYVVTVTLKTARLMDNGCGANTVGVRSNGNIENRKTNG